MNTVNMFQPLAGVFWWCHICLFQSIHIAVVYSNKCPLTLSFAIFSEIRFKRDRMSGSDGWNRIIIWVVPNVGPITELQLHYWNIGRTSLWLRLRSRNTHAAKLLCAALIVWQNQPQMMWLMRVWQTFREFLEKSKLVIWVSVNYKWSQLKEHLMHAYHLPVS